MSDKTHPCYGRAKMRYEWAREHGASSRQAVELMGRIDAFRAFAQSLGTDPDTLGDFARYMGLGGKPRVFSGQALERRERYYALRALGATSAVASEACGSEVGFLRAKRELTGTVFKKRGT